jgi:glycosyltransferase involved in cell wall biosynthesis/predicted O-methyltransferase YrrM
VGTARSLNTSRDFLRDNPSKNPVPSKASGIYENEGTFFAYFLLGNTFNENEVMIKQRESHFFEKFYEVYKQIPADFLGGSPLEKTYLMAYLANLFDLKNYVEIGVYRGKSFFPVAAAFANNDGHAIGIDPYLLAEAKEEDVDASLLERLNAALYALDFEQLYKDVVFFKEQLAFSSRVQLIRKKSSDAVAQVKAKCIEIDMLHIDGNHDTEKVTQDFENYLPLVKEGGVVVVDDVDWPSVYAAYEKIKDDFLVLFEHTNYVFLWKRKKTTGFLTRAKELSKKLTILNQKLSKFEAGTAKEGSEKPLVVVGVLAYNHARYIKECLNSVCMQQGDFRLKIIICDDRSTDATAEIIAGYVAAHQYKENIEICFIENKINVGFFSNIKQLINMLGPCDYFTFCEGDDYWLDAQRVSAHMKFLHKNPECVLSFNTFLLYDDVSEVFDFSGSHQKLIGGIFEARDIVRDYFIGNFSACFYDGRCLQKLPDSLLNISMADWYFNVLYAMHGDIGYIKKPMSVYRKHAEAVWSSWGAFENAARLLEYIDDYNRHSNFDCNVEFTQYRNQCLIADHARHTENVDLVIIDDVFPHPISGFRYQEFTSYCEHISSVKILTTGSSVRCLGNEAIDDLIVDYRRLHPAARLDKFDKWYPIGCKLLYFVFLNNIYTFLFIAEQFRIPFVFELYPGGGFGLNNAESDSRLRRVLKSPFFKKVIVTQKITYDYLIRNKFCTADKIKFIFGVVTPLEKLQLDYKKQNFGFDKNVLDVCFVAHKYTSHGQDKGYDVFVAIAKKLSLKYTNINFHVVGPFDKNVIDVSSVKDRITFYGTRDQAWMDTFFIDKDIIVSPNKSGLIFQGSFDGFPTASCTDAGLRKTAIFCTDELKLNHDFFKEDEEIVILSGNIDKMIEKIEYYYANPAILKKIGENGQNRIRDLYSFESQLAPRIALLKEEIASPFIYKEADFLGLDMVAPENTSGIAIENIPAMQQELAAIKNSTTWRITTQLCLFLTNHPNLRMCVRCMLKCVYRVVRALRFIVNRVYGRFAHIFCPVETIGRK